MSITEKIKAALYLSGKKNTELAQYLGMTNQSLSNKFNRGSFSAEDLVKVAEFTNSYLAFNFSDNQKVTLTLEDIKRPE